MEKRREKAESLDAYPLQIFFQCLLNAVQRIHHSPVNPFEKHIPDSSHIEGNEVVRLQLSHKFYEGVATHILCFTILRKKCIQTNQEQI